METSSLSELASLASSSLAIGLTYLILDRFKYRESIRDHAREAIDLLRGKSGSFDKDHEDKSIYQGLRFLAKLPITLPDINLKEIIPPLRLRIIYPWIYVSKKDRVFMTFCVIYSMVVLFIGRGHGIGIPGLSIFANDWFILPSFVILVAGIITPIVLVLLGTWIRESAFSKIDHDRVEMEKFMQDIGQSVAVLEDYDVDETNAHW